MTIEDLAARVGRCEDAIRKLGEQTGIPGTVRLILIPPPEEKPKIEVVPTGQNTWAIYSAGKHYSIITNKWYTPPQASSCFGSKADAEAVAEVLRKREGEK